jgi:hypothetical protein
MQLISATACLCSGGLRQEEGPQQQPDIIGSLLVMNEGRTFSLACNMCGYSSSMQRHVQQNALHTLAYSMFVSRHQHQLRHVLYRGWIGEWVAERQHTAAVHGNPSELDSLTAACVRPAPQLSASKASSVFMTSCGVLFAALDAVTAVPPMKCQSRYCRPHVQSCRTMHPNAVEPSHDASSWQRLADMLRATANTLQGYVIAPSRISSTTA